MLSSRVGGRVQEAEGYRAGRSAASPGRADVWAAGGAAAYICGRRCTPLYQVCVCERIYCASVNHSLHEDTTCYAPPSPTLLGYVTRPANAPASVPTCLHACSPARLPAGLGLHMHCCRVLSLHARLARLRSIEQGWCSADWDFEDYASESAQTVQQWLQSLPDQPETPVAQSATSEAVSTDP